MDVMIVEMHRFNLNIMVVALNKLVLRFMMDATLPMANVTTVLIVIHCFVRHLVMDIAMDSVVDVLNMVLVSRIMHWITICIIFWF